jgi:hypothetical protein
MRSRLPGKLRSRELWFDVMIVEYGAGLAESRVALRTVFGHIFDHAQNTPRQHEAQTQKH